MMELLRFKHRAHWSLGFQKCVRLFLLTGGRWEQIKCSLSPCRRRAPVTRLHETALTSGWLARFISGRCGLAHGPVTWQSDMLWIIKCAICFAQICTEIVLSESCQRRKMVKHSTVNSQLFKAFISFWDYRLTSPCLLVSTCLGEQRILRVPILKPA